MAMRDKIPAGSKWIETGWNEVNSMFYISSPLAHSESDPAIAEKKGMDDPWSIQGGWPLS